MTDSPNADGGARRSRRRRWAFGCLGALFVGAASLGLIELVLRSFMGHMLGPIAETRGLVVEAPGGTVKLAPGYRGSMTIGGETTALRINSLGTRGPDLPEPRAGERRILVFGDSMTFGWGVEDDAAFPAQLESLLDSTASPTRVLNAGVPSYGTREMALAFERLDPVVRPDIVVACVYVGNDFDDDVWIDKVVAFGGLMLTRKTVEAVNSSWRGWLAIHSCTALLIEQQLQRWSPQSNLFVDIYNASQPDGAAAAAYADWPPIPQRLDCMFLDAEPPGDVQKAAFARAREALGAMCAQAGKRPFVVAVLPTWRSCVPGQYEASLLALGLDPAKHRKGNRQRAIAAIAQQLGAVWIDLGEALSTGDDPAANFIPADHHLSPRGHRVVAEALAAKLR